jgi:hypothetical protein
MDISTPASTITLQKSFGSLKALPAPAAPVSVFAIILTSLAVTTISQEKNKNDVKFEPA